MTCLWPQTTRDGGKNCTLQFLLDVKRRITNDEQKKSRTHTHKILATGLVHQEEEGMIVWYEEAVDYIMSHKLTISMGFASRKQQQQTAQCKEERHLKMTR